MTGQNSKPNINIVQDNLLAWYMATHGWININRNDFMNMLMKMDGYYYSPDDYSKPKSGLNIDAVFRKLDHIVNIYKINSCL